MDLSDLFINATGIIALVLAVRAVWPVKSAVNIRTVMGSMDLDELLSQRDKRASILESEGLRAEGEKRSLVLEAEANTHMISEAIDYFVATTDHRCRAGASCA